MTRGRPYGPLSFFTFAIGVLFAGLFSESGHACEESQTSLKGDYEGAPFEVALATFAPVRGDSNANPSFERSLIVLPPTGGMNYIDRSYARKFCRAGYRVLVLKNWTGYDVKRTDLDVHQEFYSRMLKAVDLSLGDVDSEFIGMLGTSVGGLFASVAATKFERLDAVFAIVAGTPLAEVIAGSDQSAMRKLAKDRKDRFGLDTPEKHIVAIGAALELEPTRQPELKTRPRFGMIVSDSDSTVPTANQLKLAEFWKPSKLITMGTGHFWTIVRTWMFYDDEILEFFNRD